MKTRNIIIGALLLLLASVAAFLIYKEVKKEQNAKNDETEIIEKEQVQLKIFPVENNKVLNIIDKQIQLPEPLTVSTIFEAPYFGLQCGDNLEVKCRVIRVNNDSETLLYITENSPARFSERIGNVEVEKVKIGNFEVDVFEERLDIYPEEFDIETYEPTYLLRQAYGCFLNGVCFSTETLPIVEEQNKQAYESLKSYLEQISNNF